ncbi:MAG: hypothetical protein SGILL_008078, partial [Bacillariaceae sp.]
CFLEISNRGTPAYSADELELLWSVASKMVDKDIGTLGGEKPADETESCGANLLSANGVEMMAIAISENDIDAHVRMKSLLRAVEFLDDPYVSWKSRWSAALALERCCAVSVAKDNELNEFRDEIIGHILKFLQDSDSDVRTVAVRAANSICNQTQNQEQSQLLPDWALEQMFSLAFESDAEETVPKRIDALLRIILENTSYLQPVMKHLKEEFRHSSRGSETDENIAKSLVNANTGRKIFVDEDPNPYQEKLYLNQLAIRSLARLIKSSPDPIDLSLPRTQQLLERCNVALAFLSTSQNTGGLIHDLSRFPSAFPALHGVLSCTAVLIGSTQWKTQQTDERLSTIGSLAEHLVDNNQYLHSSIVFALEKI